MTLATIRDVAKSFKRDCSDPTIQALHLALNRIDRPGQAQQTVEGLEKLVGKARKNLEARKHAGS